MKIKPIEETKFENELLPKIIDRMFAICKEDKSFKSKAKLEAVEDVSKKLNEKIRKQKVLLNRGFEMEKDFTKRIESLDESNEKLRSDLIMMIGGDV
jgi:SOS response regulatory protein OraA/RecX